MRDLGRVEKLWPEPLFLQDDLPEWTVQMAVEFMKAAVPGVKLSNLEDPTANELGRFVGVKKASMRELEGIELTDKQWEDLERLLIKKWGEKAEEKFVEHLRFVAETFCPAYERAITTAITLASKQASKEQAEFFKGYSEVVAESPDARADTTIRIYWIMVLNWRLFEFLRQSGKYSVRQLHELLCQIFGSHLVGDLKKTEKMCERKGLSFRRRGRPRLPEKSDTKPA